MVTLNGVAFAVGSTDGYRTELLVTASDPLSGATLWSHVYDDGSGTEHAAVSVQVTAGVVVVGGETNGYWRIFGGGYAKTVSVDEWR